MEEDDRKEIEEDSKEEIELELRMTAKQDGKLIHIVNINLKKQTALISQYDDLHGASHVKIKKLTNFEIIK